MVELFEDGQRLLPGNAGRGKVSRRSVAVRNRSQGVRLVVPVAELSVEVKRPPVAGSGVGVPPETPIHVAQAVQGLRLAVPVTDVLLQVHRLLTVVEGIVVPAELGV